ncbi:TetR/AcrR family transcriptional regulator [Paenibacillus rhizoplanae]
MGKRDDILQATLDLITEEGLQSVTFAKIFKRANVGSSTFYHYFENKEQLVNELYLKVRIHKKMSSS